MTAKTPRAERAESRRVTAESAEDVESAKVQSRPERLFANPRGRLGVAAKRHYTSATGLERQT